MDCCHPGLLPSVPTLDALLFLSTGFLMSFGHCIGMCGPLVGAYATAQCASGPGTVALAGARPWYALLPALTVYHLGRVTAYAAIGLVFGLVGSVAQLGGRVTLQGGLSLVVGLTMLALGMGLVGWLPTQRWVESSRLGGAVIGRVRGFLGTRRTGGRFLLGAANGLLPCGPVYAMAVATLAVARPAAGAGAMALYGAGTVPVLVALGLGAGRLGPTLRRRFNRAGAALVVVIGLQLALRGAAAFGWIGHVRLGEVVFW